MNVSASGWMGVLVCTACGIFSTSARSGQFTEVLVTPTPLGDVEFDWGRDGIDCPTCNFGEGNSRLNWTERASNLWIAHIDASDGSMPNQSAQDELVDTTAAFWNTYGNGPEWAFSTQNGVVNSQLVYTRYMPGRPENGTSAGAAFATETGPGVWEPAFFPGAVDDGDGSFGTNNSNLPLASQCNSDSVATALWKNFAQSHQVFTEPVSNVMGTSPELTPFGSYSNGIGERFVPCTRQLLFQGEGLLKGGEQSVQQVFWYDFDTQVVEQLTTDPTAKFSGFMFQAPDFGGKYIFFTISKRLTIDVYEETGINPDGSPIFRRVNQIKSTDPREPYMNSAEPFINCTPTCRTYVFSTLAPTPDAQKGVTTPIGLAVIALSPDAPSFEILAAAQDTPDIQRLDPEYFITANGPYIYYNRIQLQTDTQRYQNLGEWYVDAQLGAPSGPCVGSSAEGGLVAGCDTNGPQR